ncbi:YqhG family protein [Radiobacillus kanasensis]|uniref:YqhG family protein n=1 Tax=Radiobacillus kanasensis TaxID=2844358 RepID=UPI001E61F2A5|nr:YqhG family protein [Radiobacillus kanasensis]UFT97756.1 YqhG family protein [Radiobacillus kanasensis]
MAIENLHDFMENYFKANDCSIVENNNGKLKIQLTDVMDELLMNRPFYWQYVKKLGYPGQPMEVSFITNPERREEEGEWIHFGSPRVHQIFRTLKTQGRMTKLYEQIQAGQRTPLTPWLVINMKISYEGKQKKDEVVSFGLNLINGAMLKGMMEAIEDLSFHSNISDFSYTMTPIIRIKSGYQRIIQYIEKSLQQEDHDWAAESLKHLQEELQLLDHFYTEGDQQDSEEEAEYEQLMEQERKDIENRYQPTIRLEVVNGGLFYLSQTTSNQFLQK